MLSSKVVATTRLLRLTWAPDARVKNSELHVLSLKWLCKPFRTYRTTSTSEQESLPCHVVDLRSDTVTKPNVNMRRAMFEAEVGDDVLREDPTVTRLEEKVATLLGMERALFVPSGTMGNLIATMVHCSRRGAEVLLGNNSHMFLFEQGGMAQIAGVQANTLANLSDGTFSLEELVSKIRSEDIHNPITSLICIENTHNICGGKVLPLPWLKKLGELSQAHNIPIHVDGARLFNAAVKLKISAAELLRDCASCSVCLSKGLGAPVGSVIAGSEEFIDKALRVRKALGGGMRQAGILAAAGLVSLDSMIERLEDDHHHAQIIAQAIKDVGSAYVTVEPGDVHTNIVMVHLDVDKISPDDFCQRMAMVTDQELVELKNAVVVKMFALTATDVRFCLHCDITREDAELAASKFQYVIKEIECSK